MNKDKTIKDKERGRILSAYYGVGKVAGLTEVFLNEILLDDKGRPAGIAIGFEKDVLDVLFFEENIGLGTFLYRSYEPFSIFVSENSIGRIIDGLSQPLDGLGRMMGDKVNVFNQAPPIIEREEVEMPLITGIKMIDTALPLGRGQRELIIGDRMLGKSTIATDIVLNQKKAEPPVFCVYVVVGQSWRKLRDLVELLRENNSFLYTTVVAAPASDSLASQFLAPFVGCAIGEYFRDRGRDALVVYDDLSKHAKVYRDISLLLGRIPGREAYPADVFSLHAGLLERAAKLSDQRGGGSLTALPIAETQEGDIASFIPTNLISITDGQIYLERGLFQKGFLPAINVGLSVSRIGGRAQPTPLRQVTAGIRLALSQHKELQKLSQLETTLSREAKRKIERGELVLEILKQEKHTRLTWPEQVVVFYAAENGFFDDIPLSQIREFESMLVEYIKTYHKRLLINIKKRGIGEEEEEEIAKLVSGLKKEFLPKNYEELS